MPESTAKDISGIRFGNLIAVRRVGTKVLFSGKKRALWRFKCDCGGSTVTMINISKKTKNNGCSSCLRDRKVAIGKTTPIRYGPRVDITGKVFGSLTVVGIEEGRKWKCVCKCGTVIIRDAGELRGSLKRGRSLLECKNCEKLKFDLVGTRFGRLLVTALVEATKSGNVWLCQCDCGGTSLRPTSQLKKTKTSGCKDCERLRRAEIHLTHGGAFGGKSRLYNLWKGMRNRCSDPDNLHYGAKGIKVCEEWQDFAPFRRWANEHGYANTLSIDRIDPNQGYSPQNCEWVTRDENSRRVFRPRNVELMIDAMLSA